MRLFFSPAIALIGRLNYTQKLPMVGLMALIAATVVMYSLFTGLNQTIRTSQRQLQGIALIEPITRTVQAVQRHRGLSVALLSGSEVVRDRRVTKAAETDTAFKTLATRLPAHLAASSDFRHIQQEWQRLRQVGLQWTAAESFAAHTRLIGQLHAFNESVADDYALMTDSELGSFYLVDAVMTWLPHTLEHLGQVRALGSGMLAAQQASETQKIDLRVTIGELNDTVTPLNTRLAKVSRNIPALQSALSAVSADVTTAAQQLTRLAEPLVSKDSLTTPTDVFLDAATAEIDKVYVQIYATLLPATKALTEARIVRAQETLYTSIGTTLLIFLVMAYFALGNYFVIVDSIRSLAQSARAFADGDLNARVKLETRDELSRVGESFNEMANGFSAMFEARREDELRLRATIDTAMDAVVQMDAAGFITGWNLQAEKTFGWTREEALGRALHETIIPLQYREAHQHGLQRFLSGGDPTILNARTELLGLRRDSHEFPIELSITAVKTMGKHEFNAFIRDITQKKQSEERIWEQANFDALTGLPNRHMFHDRIEQDIKKAQRSGLKSALLYIDLDKFKEINDTLGHDKGDMLLKEAAHRISSCARATDTVARMGGDEFTVILTELDDTGSIERVAASILQNLEKPFLLEHETVYVSASIGITLYPDDATDTNDLLRQADQAMYAAKNEGRNRFSYFTQSMQQAAQARLRLINELRGALASSQFMLYYQPILNMATGTVDKAEALIRWQHPKLGLVSPGEFIPLAEEAGLIVEIGNWAFREAAYQLKQWRTQCNAEFQLSVNVSPVQFGKNIDSPCPSWFDYLRELDLPGRSMNIEITEGLLLDQDRDIINKLLECHNAGIQIAIDDFGTGYSSLSYLKKFDIDYLKIDQSFVRDLVTDPNDMALSEAIIVMAHKLGLKVIAEGVETDAQCTLLAEAGCDYAQGYLFSRPVPADEFGKLLKAQPRIMAGFVGNACEALVTALS